MEATAFNAAIAGMNANAAKMAVAANNIANANTDSFKRSRAVISQNQARLPETHVTTDNSPGSLVNQPQGLPGGEVTRELSNVDLAEEIIQMKIAEFGYRANASIIPATADMVGSILDIIA